MGTQLPLPKKGGRAPQFSEYVYCGQTVEWIKMALGTQVGLDPGHILLDGDPAPPPQKRGQSPPNFQNMSIVAKQLNGSRWHLAHRWASIQATLLDGDPAPNPQRGTPPIFGPCLLWPNGWMDEDATWYGSWPRPRPRCVIWGCSSPAPRKRHISPPPLSGPCLLWPRSPVSAIAELLYPYLKRILYFCVVLENSQQLWRSSEELVISTSGVDAGVIYHHNHNRFTALFTGPPGWADARRELLDFMVQGKINKGRHTDHAAGRHSIRTNQCLPPPSPMGDSVV